MQTLIAKRRWIIGAAYLYLTIPLCIYFIGWLQPTLSFPLTVLMLYGAFAATRNFSPSQLKAPKITTNQFLIVGLMILAWVLLSGIGGYVWQNRFDHEFRNGVFQDLVQNDWPVLSASGSRMLVYYFGFWMPSALVGKLFGLEAGYAFQVLWAVLGTGLAFCLLSYVLKKFSWVTMLIFIFFSGLDVIPFLINVSSGGYPPPDAFIGNGIFPHIELELQLFNSSSNTTLLFWVYNQTIPFWVGFFLIIMQKNNKNLVFTYSLLALFAPMPMLGMFPAVLFLMYQNAHNSPRKLFVDQLRLQNLAGIVQAGIIALFYATNISVNTVEIINPFLGAWHVFLYYFAIEFGLYLLWLSPKVLKNKLLLVLMASMTVFSFIRIGFSYDFAWRTCIPFMLFVLTYLLHRILHSWKSMHWLRKAFIIIVLLVGSITPLMEMARTVHNTVIIAIEKQQPGTYPQGTYQHDITVQPYRLDYLMNLADTPDQDMVDVQAFKNFIGDATDEASFNRYFRK